MSLVSRFASLKEKVGGNREKQQFEFTMGRSVAEKCHITEPSASNKRILSELQFALGLTKRQNGKWDTAIDSSLQILENCMEAEGVLTNSACKQAEEVLLPMRAEAKEYEVLYASHAHIDMNWMWGWQETVAVTLSTFRTMLNLMNEYPEFTFSQSQASVYSIVQQYDPDMMKEIQARIAEGRWEVTANAWVETDKNMPDTESLLRHISCTRKYLEEEWGIPAGSVKVDFSPDTFGHSRFVPEIDSFGNVPYYYHCRGLQDELTLYRYVAPSGKEVLMYKEPYWYNSGVCPDNGTGVFELEERCNGLKTSLIVYGVGDHGGGPSRRDIENVLEMQTWPIFPTLRFGTIHQYFEKAEAVREGLPVIDHEINAIFTGCYSTQSRIKLANRRTEAALLDAECASTLAHYTVGTTFPAQRFENAWQNVLFTHFHDILTGSCVQESREYAMGRLATSLATAQTESTKAFEKLSQAVKTDMFPSDNAIAKTLSEGAGVGFGIASYAGVPNPERGAGKTRVYTIFNTSPVERKELAECVIWDYSGHLDRLGAVDSNGNPVPFQLLDEQPVQYWDHSYTRVLLQVSVPPMGYATYAFVEKEPEDYPTFLLHAERTETPREPVVLENEKLCARFDTGSGRLMSVTNKSTGEELLSAPAGLHLIHSEDAGMSAWRIGRYLTMEPVCDTSRVTITNGALRNSVTFEMKVMHSTVKMTVSLDAGASDLHYALSVDWHETRSGQEWIPLLTYRLPLKKGSDSMLCDVPAGAVLRPSREMDVPCLSTACAATEDATLALTTDCKYGYRLSENVLTVTLINTAGDPDPYPERGIHAINMYVSLTDGKPSPATVKYMAETLVRPMTCVPTSVHPGTLPSAASLLNVCAAHSVVSSVFVGKEDSLNVRLYEAEGTEDVVTITAPFAPKKVVFTDLDGNTVSLCDAPVEIQGNSVSFHIPAWSISQAVLYPV